MAKDTTYDKVIEDAINLINRLKKSWDTEYATFADYRRMAAGDLPKAMKEKLADPKYKYKSKLKPRVIPDAIKDLTGYLSHTLFHNRDGAFEFVPVEEQDAEKADKATKLVSYCWERTNVKMTSKSILRDTAAVGTGYGLINQWIDRRFVPPPQGIVTKLLGRKGSFNEIYRGPKLIRVKAETLYPQKVKSWENVSALARIFPVPVSRLLYETTKGGLYEGARDSILKLERHEFEDPDILTDIWPENQNDTQAAAPSIKDFPVLMGELWQLFQYKSDDFPMWYCITIADFNNIDKEKPAVIRFARDPMRTNNHPFIRTVIFPNDDRLNGYAVPEMLKDLNLEMFHKRNQSIDYINLLMAVHGTIWGKQHGMAPDDITMAIGRYKELKSGSPKELHTVTLDTSPLIAANNEIALIEHDIERTMAQNKITSGRDPARREAATIGALIDENAKIRQTDPIEEFEESFIKPCAREYLLQSQVFMTAAMRLRVLGMKGMWEWETVTPEEIMGSFDVKCVASSQIIPRAMKQANLNAIFQTLGNNPYVAPKLDWLALTADLFETMEYFKGKKYIQSPTIVRENIQRENEYMKAYGMPWIPVMSDDHPAHIEGHMADPDVANSDNGKMHIMEHQGMLRQLQGQSGGNQSALYTQAGEMMNDFSATSAPKALGR